MEQLFSAFGIDWRLLIAQAVNFGIVLIALRYFLYQPVLAMLAKRQQIVMQSVDDAAKAQSLLAGADEVAAQRVAAADVEAETIVASAREVGSSEKARLLKEAEDRALAIAHDAHARASEVANRALRESEQEIARLAILAAEKVLRTKV